MIAVKRLLSRTYSVILGLKPASDQSMPLWKGSLIKKEGLRSWNPQNGIV